VGWVGDDSHAVFGKTLPCEKGSMGLCYFDETVSSSVAKVHNEVFAHFHAVAVKCHRRFGTDRLAWQDKFFNVKENDEQALNFDLHLPCYFRSQ
jgi:hypothetical protein